MSIGALIKARIKALGTTQREVCERSGLSTGFLSDVINDKKRLGADGARRLAPVLDVPMTELLGEPALEVEQWFWATKFATMSVDELSSLRRASMESRVAWVISELQQANPDLNIAERLNMSPEKIQQFLNEEVLVNELHMKLITDAFKLPEHFLKAGEPGANTILAQQVLSRHNATEWLTVIKYAMDHDVPPAKVLDAIRLFLSSV